MKTILSLSSLLLVLACASTAKKFKVEEKGDKQGVVFGRITVMYNGINFNNKCRVLYDTRFDMGRELERDGLVMYHMNEGEHFLRRVECTDVSEQHYGFKDTTFTVTKGTKNYFGDITIDWKNKGGLKGTGFFGTIGAISDQSTNDGQASIKVEDKQAETFKDFRAVVPADTWGVKKSLMKPGKTNH